MRSRNIKPSFFKNETLGTMDYDSRLLFIGLWLMADKEGFLEYRPLRIKAELFPYDKIDSGKIEKLLEKLCNLEPHDKLIEIWCENKKPKFIQIINFVQHQSPHKNEKSYKIKELIFSHENSCNYTTFQGITLPYKERGKMNDECGMMNDDSHDSNESENDFKKFWDLYSKKHDLKKCESKWNKLKQSDKDKIFETLPAYIESTPDIKYRKNPLTYLNGNCWNDEIIKDQKNGQHKNYTGNDTRPPVIPDHFPEWD